MNPTSKSKSPLKWVLGAVALVAVAAVGVMAYRNPTLFRASLTGGGNQVVGDYALYIPDNYTAAPGDQGTIELKAGKAMTNISVLNLTVGYMPTQMTITGVTAMAGDAYENKLTPSVQVTSSSGAYGINLSFPGTPINNVAKDQTLFRFNVSIANTATGSLNMYKQSLTMTAKDNTNPSANPLPDIVPSLKDGKITLTNAESACTDAKCHAPNGACTLNPPYTCVCKTGYDPNFFCGQCATGYTGYPNCVAFASSPYTELIFTLSPSAVNKLAIEDQRKAYSAAYVVFKSVVANTNQKLVFGGKDYGILYCSSTETDPLAKLNECTLAFAENFQDPDVGPGLKASVTNIPGVVKVEPLDPNGTLLGIQSGSSQVLVVPAMEDVVMFDPLATYQTKVMGFVVGQNTVPVITENVPFSEATLVASPASTLKSSSLEGGLLEMDASGSGVVRAETVVGPDDNLESNSIRFYFTPGPQVDWIRRIGTDAIVQGSTVNLNVRLSDKDSIENIDAIQAFVVRSAGKTYESVKASYSQTDWISATAIENKKDTVPSGSVGTTEQEGQGAGTSVPAVVPPTYYKVIDISVDIPQDPTLIDGPYVLVLEIKDKSGNLYGAILPIQIGAQASGDVTGDGEIDLLDVGLAYRFYTKAMTPTSAQLQAADLNGNGVVEFIDVANLWRKSRGL